MHVNPESLFLHAALIDVPEVSLCLHTRDMMITKKMTEEIAGIASNRSRETVSTRNVSIVPYQQKQRMAGQIAFRSCTEEIQ